MSLNGSKITVIVGAQWGDEGKGKLQITLLVNPTM
jgi:adenylosuccinate synthase